MTAGAGKDGFDIEHRFRRACEKRTASKVGVTVDGLEKRKGTFVLDHRYAIDVVVSNDNLLSMKDVCACVCVCGCASVWYRKTGLGDVFEHDKR